MDLGSYCCFNARVCALLRIISRGEVTPHCVRYTEALTGTIRTSLLRPHGTRQAHSLPAKTEWKVSGCCGSSSGQTLLVGSWILITKKKKSIYIPLK